MVSLSSPVTTFTLRHPTRDDIPAVVDVVNASVQHDQGIKAVTTVERLNNSWDTPGLDIPANAFLAHTPADQLAGFCTCLGLPDKIASEVTVHPNFRGQGLEQQLMDKVEYHAQTVHLPNAPANQRVALMGSAHDKATWLKDLYAKNGYEVVRGFWKMKIELDAPPPAPTWPTDIELRLFNPDTDQQAIYAADKDAFSEHWGESDTPFDRWWYSYTRNETYDPTLWFIAWAGDEIAGYALCYGDTPDDPDQGHVGVLGVRKPYRKHGLGLALLYHAFTEFKARGSDKAMLYVDSENLTGATRLYERAGMRVAEKSFFYEKVLREGE